MPSDDREMEWVGPSHSRAERLPEKLWESYKQELRRLYEIMTLDDLMSFMSLRYNFRPTRRQYVYHLHKWGFRKYGGEAQAEPSAQMTSNSDTFPIKRKPSASMCTEGSNPDAHGPKRQMLQTPTEFKNPLHGLGLSFDTINADEHHLLFRRSDDYRAPALDDFEQWTKGQRLLNDSNVRSVHVDVSQNIDAFSNEDICEMKRAADFLAAMWLRSDAFTLYVLILKRLRASPTCPDWMVTWTTIACSRTAATNGQMEIVRALLEQRLEECPGSAPLINQFVAHMLLADTYARTRDQAMEKFHIEAAANVVHSNELLLSYLPNDYRTFDLWTFHFLVRRCSHCVRNKCAQIPCSQLNTPFYDQAKRKATVRMIMNRKPGPFEIEDRVMANPCLRSCLIWTARGMAHVQNDPGLLDALNSTRLNKRHSSSRYWILYCALWEHWQSGAEFSEDQPLWATTAEKLMGISASMLLRIVVHMIKRYKQVWPADHLTDYEDLTEWCSADYYRAKVSELLQESDEMLAEMFLDIFSYQELLHRSVSGEKERFSDIVREYAKRKLEQGLQLILPEIIFNTSSTGANSQDGDTSKARTSSFASISTDSDFLSFRSLQKRIRKGVRTAGQVAKTTRPSSVYRRGPADAASLLNMSDLSSAFQSVSLNSSGARSGSMSM